MFKVEDEKFDSEVKSLGTFQSEQKILSETFIKLFESVIKSDLADIYKNKLLFKILEMEWL